MSDYIINKPDDFELNETLECGQCFHFKKLDENDYVLTAFGHMLHIMQTEKEIVFYDTDGSLININKITTACSPCVTTRTFAITA